MTRFARAKGSKSSNERAPEDGTPWEVMKEQLLQAKKESEDGKKRKEAEKQRIENYENFLKEQKTQKRKATWCDFPEAQLDQKKQVNVSLNGDQPAKKKKKNKQKATNEQLENTILENCNNEISVTPEKQSKKKKKNKQNIQNDPSAKVIDETNASTKESKENVTEHQPSDITPKNKPKKKKNKKNKLTPISNEPQTSVPGTEEYEKPQKKKNKKDKQTTENAVNTSQTDKNTNKQNKIKALKKKKDKLVDGQPVRRKEITERSFQLIINAKEVELVRYDGFPIMKKDAERLAELKESMIKKGIPKSEVQRTMKLERRRAEKALARLKRDVCYNCRKGGHNLSDCPELKSKIPGVDAAEGVCFKCGSTEHRQFECKVQRDKEFRFATCFICKEPGHIARQCPDNPKGLYPNGGSCKLCGDVTHLRKDCPTINHEKEEKSVKLQTLDSTDDIEDIGKQAKASFTEETSKKPKKIKF